MTKHDRLPPGWREHSDKAIEALRLERLYRIGCAHGAQGDPATANHRRSETRAADTNPRAAEVDEPQPKPPELEREPLMGPEAAVRPMPAERPAGGAAPGPVVENIGKTRIDAGDAGGSPAQLIMPI